MTLPFHQVVLLRRTESLLEGTRDPTVTAGTGYLVDQRTILTAGHCVGKRETPDGIRVVLEVCRPGRDNKWMPATVAARHQHVDLAVLQLTVDSSLYSDAAVAQDAGGSADQVRTPLLGVQDSDGGAGITSVELTGFPRAQRQKDGTRLPEWVPGDLLPPAADPSVLSINVRTALPRRFEVHSPWGGMSGSPVFAEDACLIGVVTQDNLNYDGRLQAVALHPALATDTDFASCLPAEWQDRPVIDLSEFARYRIDDRLSIQISSPTAPLSPLVEEQLPDSLAELTSARHALVPFIDREELNQLRTGFLETSALLQVALVYGSAGCGKSRLADELHRVARAGGWKAGLVTAGAGAPEVRRLQVSRPLLLIFDYAESRVPQIKKLLTYLVNMRPAPDHRVRILLLARSAEGPWMNTLKSHVPLGRSIPHVSVNLAHRPLEAEARRHHYSAAAKEFANRLSVREPPPEVEPDLTEDVFGLPLLVHIQALLDVHSTAPAPASGPPAESPPTAQANLAERLLQGLLDREWERYWQPRLRRIGPAVDEDGASELVALASLAGADSRDEAALLLSSSRILAEASEEARTQAAEVLHELYVGSGDAYLSPVQPDLLGEFLIGRHLLSDDRLSSVLRHCSRPQQRVRIIQVLRRMTTSPVLSASGRSHEALRQLLELRLSSLVNEAVDLATRRMATGGRQRSTDRAQWSLARTLAEALTATPVPAAAAALLRQFDSVFPVGFPELTDLAITLHEQAMQHLDEADETLLAAKIRRVLLGHLGWRDPSAALGVAEQGASLNARIGVVGQPSMPLLTGASAQAQAVLRVGRVSEARTFAQEAVDLLHAHEDDGPEVREELAKALSVLSLTLVNVKDFPKALESADEAVRIQEGLRAAGGPDADLAVAGALLLQGMLLSIGNQPGALDVIERAVELLQDRADRSGGADGLSELIGAECALANLRASRGDLDGAWQAALTARSRAADYVTHSAGELDHVRAAVETSMAIVAWARNDIRVAVDAVRTAIEIYENLSAQYESMFTAPLLTVYLLAGPILLEGGRPEEAWEQLETAAEWTQELAQDNEGTYLTVHINAILMMASFVAEAEQQHAAALAREAVKLAREHTADDPVAGAPFLAQTLFSAASVLEAGNWREADALLTEAVSVWRSADPELSSVGAPLALTIMCALVALRLGNKAFDRVVDLAEDGERAGRSLVSTVPDVARLILLLMQGASAAHAGLANEVEEVVADTRIVDFLRGLAEKDIAYRPDLAEALESLSKTLRKVGIGDHVTLFAEAVALRLELAQARGQAPTLGRIRPERPDQPPMPLADPAPPEDLGALAEHADHPNSIVIGCYRGMPVAAAPFRPVLVLGPQRSRKTTGIVIPTLLDWDGPVLVTSVRTDVIASTIDQRTRRGRAQIFEPTGKLYEGSATCQWNPLADARDWSGAVQTAHWLSEAGAKSNGIRDRDFWYNMAAQLLAPHLHAAAVSGRTMGDVYEWVKGGDADIVDHYLGVGDPAARIAWEGIRDLDRQVRSSIYATLMTSLSVYESSAVRAARSALFDIDEFFDGRSNTLYLCAPPDDQEVLAPLFVGLIRRVLREAYERHSAGASHRLLVLLDEAGNIAPLRNLDTLATTTAGTEIQLVTVFHDVSQMIAKFDVHQAKTILNNHSALLVLSGNRDPDTSAYVRDLLREDPVPVSLDSGMDEPGGGRQFLRRLQPGTALCFYEHLPSGVVRLRSSSHDDEFRTLAAPIEDDPQGRWRRLRSDTGRQASVPAERRQPGPGATSCVW